MSSHTLKRCIFHPGIDLCVVCIYFMRMMKNILLITPLLLLIACQAPIDQKTYSSAPTKRVQVSDVSKLSVPEFHKIPAGKARKEAFINHIKPLIEQENKRLLQIRQKLLMVRYASVVSEQDQSWLKRIAAKYDVNNFSRENANHWKLLFKRIDIVPVKLAVAQAANESGWGSSRFARQGKNLFGHWCFQKGCGIVPKKRNPGATHEVAKFSSFKQSIKRYMHNLNTGDVYKKLRDIRFAQREEGRELSSYELADGLKYYSERRDDYVRDIKSMIMALK